MEPGSNIHCWWPVSNTPFLLPIYDSMADTLSRAGIVGFVKIGEAYAANDRKFTLTCGLL